MADAQGIHEPHVRAGMDKLGFVEHLEQRLDGSIRLRVRIGSREERHPPASGFRVRKNDIAIAPSLTER